MIFNGRSLLVRNTPLTFRCMSQQYHVQHLLVFKVEHCLLDDWFKVHVDDVSAMTKYLDDALRILNNFDSKFLISIGGAFALN